MVKKTLVLLSLVGLAACASAPVVPEDSRFVPTKAIVDQIAVTPYECFDYNARKDTCGILAKHSISGNTLTTVAAIQERTGFVGTIRVDIHVDAVMTPKGFCANPDDFEFELSGGTLNTNQREMLIRMVERRMANDGISCFAYLQDARGQYYNAEINTAGDISGDVEPTMFLQAPKPLS